MRIMTLFCGIVLMITGVFVLANPGVTFVSIAFVIGGVMVFHGTVLLAGHIIGRRGKIKDRHSWILVDGIITIFIGILILANQLTAEIAIPFIFGLWLIYSGVLRVVAATQIDRKAKKKNFLSALIIGILLIVVGIYSFTNPLIIALSLMGLIGLFFMAQGVATIELGINMPHKKKEEVPKRT